MKVKIDRADKVFSQYIRTRDKQCKRCGSKVEFNSKGEPISHQNSHFMGRGKESTRFNEYNCDTLCMGCHLYFTAHPADHYAWQVQQKGQDKVNQIVLLSHQYKKKNRDADYEYWKGRLKEIQ